MTGYDALKLVFQEGNFALNEDHLDVQDVYLDDLKVQFYAHDDFLHLTCEICALGEDERHNSFIIEQFCALTASTYIDHKINSFLKDDKLYLELILNQKSLENGQEIIENVSVFLDDCDMFKKGLESLGTEPINSFDATFFKFS